MGIGVGRWSEKGVHCYQHTSRCWNVVRTILVRIVGLVQEMQVGQRVDPNARKQRKGQQLPHLERLGAQRIPKVKLYTAKEGVGRGKGGQ